VDNREDLLGSYNPTQTGISVNAEEVAVVEMELEATIFVVHVWTLL
jgi:hypothetical protein